jgi:TonB family protein
MKNMKTKLSISLLSLILVATQACGPSTDNKEKTKEDEGAVVKLTSLTTTQKRAQIEKRRKTLELKRETAYAELVKSKQYYELPSGKYVYYVVETAPHYIGGEKAMTKFLEDNLTYPKGAEYAELEGTVFVDFIVSANGQVRETEATDYTYDKVDPVFTTEAIRVVQMMPLWSPGLQNGKPVDVKFSIPISFQMN